MVRIRIEMGPPTTHEQKPGQCLAIDTAANIKFRNVLDRFMFQPFSSRENFKNSLPEADKKRIDEEMQYLRTIREELGQNANRQRVVRKLGRCYHDWRTNIHLNVRRIQAEVQKSDLYGTWSCARVKEEDIQRLDRLARAEPSRSSAWRAQAGGDSASVSPASSDQYFGINSHAMYFRKSKEYFTQEGMAGVSYPETWNGHDSDDARFSGHFPHQRIPVKELFSQDHTPLKRQSNSECIRYFHIPTNNMNWVEVSQLLTWLDAAANRVPGVRKP